MTAETDRDAKEQQVCEVAQAAFARTSDWVVFFREILGLEGVVRKIYGTREALADFETTETFAEVQQMLTILRQRSRDNPPAQEPIKVITVRLPKSLHDALKAEAYEYKTSMNQLCISKLLQFIDSQLVPTD